MRLARLLSFPFIMVIYLLIEINNDNSEYYTNY